MSVGGQAPYPVYTLDVQGDGRFTNNLTLKRGSDALSGTLTHLPYLDGVNYIRGKTILADTSNAERVGIGTTTPAYKLDVLGTTRLSSVIIGTGGSSTINYLWLGNVTIGTSASQKKTVNASFPTGSQPSTSNYLVFTDFQSGNDDIFIGKVRAKTTTGFDIVTYRADGVGWGTSVDCSVMVIGY